MFARKENIEIEFRDEPCDGKELLRYYTTFRHADGGMTCRRTSVTHRDASWEVYVLL